MALTIEKAKELFENAELNELTEEDLQGIVHGLLEELSGYLIHVNKIKRLVNEFVGEDVLMTTTNELELAVDIYALASACGETVNVSPSYSSDYHFIKVNGVEYFQNIRKENEDDAAVQD